MAYAFTNLANLVDGRSDDQTQRAAKTTLGSGQTLPTAEQQPAAQGTTARPRESVLGRQFAANRDVMERGQQRASQEISNLASQGRGEISQQAETYRAGIPLQSSEDAGQVRTAIQSGSEADLARLNATLGGAGADPAALDVDSSSATRLGGILAGGGAQHLTRTLGGSGILENIMGRVGGADLQRQAEAAGRELGEFAETTEKETSKEMAGKAKAARESRAASLRQILQDIRTGILAPDATPEKSEAERYARVGEEERAALEKRAMEAVTPELDRLYGTQGAGLAARAAAMPTVREIIRGAISKSSQAPTVRTAGEWITPDEAAQLSRVAGLIGGTAPVASQGADYSGQYQIDPNVVQRIVQRLFPAPVPTPTPVPNPPSPAPRAAEERDGGAGPGERRGSRPVAQPERWSVPLVSGGSTIVVIPAGQKPEDWIAQNVVGADLYGASYWGSAPAEKAEKTPQERGDRPTKEGRTGSSAQAERREWTERKSSRD